MDPRTRTTTETISWQWPCGAACKMERQGTRALAAVESSSDRHTLNPAAPVVAATEFWVPDPYLMVQQLREFESLNDEAVALRVQLEEYTEEIDKSKKDNNGRNWFLALPENIRNVLVMARDAISSYIAISTPPAK
ncbi:hypothetical protein QOZ80_6BG0467710 [Eleusine coracana subsp. coracana]|nr:hypothetical protein QOZ80_6BG0467710 [Eleusine coracana subsp. coracana]